MLFTVRLHGEYNYNRANLRADRTVIAGLVKLFTVRRGLECLHISSLYMNFNVISSYLLACLVNAHPHRSSFIWWWYQCSLGAPP